MKQFSNAYIFGFTAIICVVCSLMISVSAVSLRERQERNKLLERHKNVLQACGLMGFREKLSAGDIEKRFSESIREKFLDLGKGEYIEASEYSADSMKDAPEGNPAGILEMPTQAPVYHVIKDGKIAGLVLPIYGKGLWSTLYGYFALDADADTVRGITYYQHGETPGLGGEVDNPKWKDRWTGRKLHQEGKVALKVIKGKAGDAAADPHKVDGLSGATLTSNGVSHMIAFWMGEQGFSKYLEKFRAVVVAPAHQCDPIYHGFRQVT